MPWGSNTERLRAFKATFGSSKTADAPAQVYVALLQAAAGQEDTTLGTEPDSTGDYVRVAVANDDTFWAYAAAGGSNAVEVRWPAATAQYSITTALNQWAVYDNSAGGALVAFGKLTTTITVTGAGDVPVIPASAMVLTVGA